MRQLRAHKWKAPTWDKDVRDSGLANILAIICALDTNLELASAEISRSYRHHSWKESFGEILERWTPDRVFATTKVEKVCCTSFHLKLF